MNVNSDQVTDCVSNSMQPKTELLLIERELQIKNSSDIINLNWKINFSDRLIRKFWSLFMSPKHNKYKAEGRP